MRAHINSKHRVQPVLSPVSSFSTLPPSLIWHSEGTIELCLVSGFRNADFPFCYPSNSVIQPHHPHHGGRGEGGKGFPNPLCARRGRVMRTGRFCDSLIDLPALLPSPTIVLFHYTTFDLPDLPPALLYTFPLYHFSALIYQPPSPTIHLFHFTNSLPTTFLLYHCTTILLYYFSSMSLHIVLYV